MNQAVLQYRQAFPNDQRPDDDITLELANKFPDEFQTFPDAVSDYKRILGAAGGSETSAVGAFARGVGRNVIPAVTTAGGALLAGGAASETGPGAIPAAIVGGAAGGVVGEKINKALNIGQDEDQIKADEEQHPIASKMGEFLGQIPAMFGAGGAGKKIATGLVESGLSKAAAARIGALAENSIGGAIMSGSGAAQQVAEGKADWKTIPSEMVKGAVTMGPVGFIPHAGSVFGAIGWKAPTDAAVLGLSNALYDHFVSGKDIDPKALSQQIGTDIPGFMLMNGLSAVFGKTPWMPTRDGKITSEGADDAKAEIQGNGVQPLTTMPSQEEQAQNLDNAVNVLKQRLPSLTNEQAEAIAGMTTSEANKNLAEAVSRRDSLVKEGRPIGDSELQNANDFASGLMWKAQQSPNAGAQPTTAEQAIPDDEAAASQASPAPLMPSTPAEAIEPTPEENALAQARRFAASNPAFEDVNPEESESDAQPLQQPSPVNPDVLAEARRLAASSDASEPKTRFSDRSNPAVTMTQEEFVAKSFPENPQLGKRLHSGAVELAIRNGESVPNRVLKDYPGLVQLVSRRMQDDRAEEQRLTAGRAIREKRAAAKAALPPPLPQPWKVLTGKPEDVLSRVSFGASRLVSGDKAVGKKSAAAYVETKSPEELFKDVTANASDRKLSRKLGVFQSDDGSHVLVSTVYQNGGNDYVTAFDERGQRKAVRFDNMTGYKLVAAIKTGEPTRDFALTYSLPQWNELRNELRLRAKETTSGGVETTPLSEVAEMVSPNEGQQGSAVVSTPNADVYEWRSVKSAINPALANRLIEVIGKPNWKTVDEAYEQIEEGFSKLPSFDQIAILEAFSPRDMRSGDVEYATGFDLLKKNLYEKFTNDRNDKGSALRYLTGVQERRSPSKTHASNNSDSGKIGASGVTELSKQGESGNPHIARSGNRARGGGSTERIAERTNQDREDHRDIREFLADAGIYRRDADNWRFTKRAFGKIQGVPNSAGEIVATNGILCLIERPDSSLFEGHLNFFEPAKGKIFFEDGTPVDASPIGKAEKVASAAAEVDTNPSEAQKQSGNYQKGHVSFDGLDITLENPKGSTRSGKDANGQPWSVELPAHYGYVKGTEGIDGDHVDVYIGDNPDSDKVFVIDQINPDTKKFDEHKAMLGFNTREEALAAYTKAFSDGSGPSRIGAVTEMPKDEFVDWVHEGDTKRPLLYGKKLTTASPSTRASERGLPSQLATTEDIAGRFNDIRDSAEANGLPIRIVQDLRERGKYSPREVTLALADPLKPSHDNVTLLLHEIGHDVFKMLNLPPETEAAFHRAIEKLSKPDDQNIKIAAGADAKSVTAEEVLVERAAQKLNAEGFNPSDSQGIARRFLGYLKRLYLRSAMAIQRGLLGDNHVSPELAQRYFEQRVKAFLAGDTQPMSFLSFVGGPKLRIEQQANTYSHAGGNWPTGAAVNFDTGDTDFHEASGDTIAGVLFNQQIATRFSDPSEEHPALPFVRVTDPTVISRDYNSPAKVEVDIAAYNVLNDAHKAAWSAFQRTGLAKSGYTFEQFLRDFTNADGPATAKIQSRNEHLLRTARLAKLDWKPVDPTVRPDDLHSEVNQKQAADAALRYLWSLRSDWSERRTTDELFLKTAQEKLDRSNAALHELMTDYTDMSKQLANAKVELRSIHGDFITDFRNATSAAHRDGILTQVIKEMDSKKPDLQYAKVIDQLYREISGDNTGRFIDMLQKVAEMSIDWRTVPTRDAVKILRKIIAPADPELKSLRDRALAAITISFAKRNARVLDTLKIARSDAFDERAKLTDILKNAIRNTDDAVPRAKQLAEKLPKLAVVADRLLTDLEETKADHRAQLDAIRRAQTFISLHDAALPELNARMIQQERMIGAQTLTWEANEGAPYWLAPKPNATPDEVRANTKVLRLKGVEDNAEIIRHIQQNEAWLNAVSEDKRGADWSALRVMTNKLQQVVGIAQHEVGIKQSVLNSYLGSVVDKLESTAIPSLKMAAQKLRFFNANVAATKADADAKGIAVDGAKARAMKALGFSNVATGTFERMFYRGAKFFAERNPDIFTRQPDARTAFESFLPRLRKFLESDPDTAKRTQQHGAWRALEAYYRAIFDAEMSVNATRKQFGGKVREVMPNGQVIDREPIGVTFSTSLRRAARSTLRMYQTMRDLGWLGTTEDRPFDPDRVSREFHLDPDKLEARLQKYVTPEIQRAFLRPVMTGMQGRSAFYGPARPDGLEDVALRENVRKAYEASNGSIVQTALNLYRLESDMQGGTSEAQGDFVGKFVKNVADYFRVLHTQFAEVDDAARHGQPTPRRVFMDARLAETLPEEWLDYMQYGRFEMHELFNHLASQAAFGRNLSSIRRDFQTGSQELTAMSDRYKELSNRVVDETPNIGRRTLEDRIKQAVTADGKNYQTMKQARRNLLMVQSEMQNFQALMASYGGLELELRPFQELVSALAGATVQGPITSLVHLPNLVQNFGKLGLNKVSLDVLKRSVLSTASETFGTLFQLFHGQIGWNADLNARRVRNGIVDPDALRRFEDARVALLNDPTTATTPATRAMFKTVRAIRLATSSGLGRQVEGSPNAYVTLKPHALFSQTAALIDAGLIDGWAHGFEDMISRAVDYFQGNNPQRLDPKFRFENMTDLGYSKGFLGFGSDKRAFEYFRNALVRYGMDLETIARDVLSRREKGENPPMVTDEQFRRLASLVQNEVTLESNITNRPSSFFTNPILRLSAPLVGWSVSKTEDAWKNWRNPGMSETSQNAFKAIAVGILPYLALVPAGIALGALRDYMQAQLLGKQPNRDNPAGSLAGAMEALTWTGTFGLPGDIANAWVNRDTTRAFTPDNRVFFVSSLINAKRALQMWLEQGNADYATVYRPLMQSLGGGGALQYLDLTNRMLSLDNEEARVTARLNVANILRVTGRELGLSVRPSADAGDSAISKIKLPLGQMVLAAIQNDAATFKSAYIDALKVAKEEGKTDPKKYLAEAFAAHSPLRSVFITPPTHVQYEQMLAAMSPESRVAAGSAIFRFNRYLEQLGGKEFEGKQPSNPVQVELQAIRRAAFGGPSPVSTLTDARRIAANWSNN